MDHSSPAPSPGYPDLLEAAYSLGRADGVLAARIEPGEPDPSSRVCRGRDPEQFARWLWEEFARWLWGEQPGPPPSGLELNAPLWYARGFATGLADERRRETDVRREAFAWIQLRGRRIPRG